MEAFSQHVVGNVVKTRWILSEQFLKHTLPETCCKSANIVRRSLRGSYYVLFYNYTNYIALQLKLDSISPTMNENNYPTHSVRSRGCETRVKTKYRFAVVDEQTESVRYVFGEWRLKSLSTPLESFGFLSVVRKSEISPRSGDPFSQLAMKTIRFQIEICEIPTLRHYYRDDGKDGNISALQMATTSLKVMRLRESNVIFHVTDCDHRVHELAVHSSLLENHSKVFTAFLSYYSSRYFSSTTSLEEHSKTFSGGSGDNFIFALHDFSYKTYLCLVSYLYVGYLDSPYSQLDIVVLAELLLLADKYDIRELGVLCQRAVIASWTEIIRTESDAAQIFYEIADCCGMIFFKDCITDLFVANKY